MRIIFLIIGFLVFEKVKSQSTIYSFSIDSIAGSTPINFSQLQGKRILIVTTASNDSSFYQYQELKILYEMYKDSFAIVAVPTNSFGTETGSGSLLANTYAQLGNYRFPVTAKTNVTNPSIHSLFYWLTTKSQNGLTDVVMSKPYYKFFIDKNGHLIGWLSSSINPLSNVINELIHSSGW